MAGSGPDGPGGAPPGPAFPNYWDYLQLERLLALQGGLEGDDAGLSPDELHFIIVHQAFELWFKLVLRELRLARDHLGAPRLPEEAVPHVVHHLRRINAIMGLLVQQFAIAETLTPQDFLAFRDKLVPASGFQSFQMREIEALLGLEDAARIADGGFNPLDALRPLTSGASHWVWERLERARQEPTLRAGLLAWMRRTPIQGSTPGDAGDEQVVVGFLEDYLAALEEHHEAQIRRHAAVPGASGEAATRARFRAQVEAARGFLFAEDVDAAARAGARRTRAGLLFIEAYRQLPLLAWPRLLVDTVVELEEQFVLWRTRHARMVERVIGRRIGTGGSSGVDYLDATTRYRIFGELWTVRTLLLPREALPPLRNADFYGFAARDE